LDYLKTADLPGIGVILGVFGPSDNQDMDTNPGGHSVTQAVENLPIDVHRISGDRHCGLTRKATGREAPLYKNSASTIVNRRQIFAVSPYECTRLTELLGVEVTPQLLGANLVIGREDGADYSISDVPLTTYLVIAEPDATEPPQPPPIATLIQYLQQKGCSRTGRAIAKAYDDKSLTKQFINHAEHHRGILCSVEYPADRPVNLVWGQKVFLKYRAPHILVSFAQRFVPGRKIQVDHPAQGISEGVFMSSRDGVNFDRRFMEGWIRPGLDPKDWMNAGTSPAWGLLQTGPEEMSVYWIQNYYSVIAGKSYNQGTCYLQRGSLRLDGFVSVHADYTGGEFRTKPLRFAGRELVVNFSTSVVGNLRVEILDEADKPIPGFTMDDCPELYGDAIEQAVAWKNGSDVSALAGQTIRLRIALKDADLYSIRFRP
jgi:hypothetical protein